jgi:hypothetical protein
VARTVVPELQATCARQYQDNKLAFVHMLLSHAKRC